MSIDLTFVILTDADDAESQLQGLKKRKDPEDVSESGI